MLSSIACANPESTAKLALAHIFIGIMGHHEMAGWEIAEPF